MATLVLRSAGAAIGTALGGPLGGIVGGAFGAVGGAVVDNLLAKALTSRRNRAPQLDTLAITHAEEGAPVRKLWGRMRLGGNVIWCTQFLAVASSQKTTSASGKGFGSSTKATNFELSFAVAFCEGGDDVSLGRVWADGNELDLSQYGINFYNGSEGQGPDGAIEAVEGAGAVPAYRGICYLVFNLMPLSDFGNRMPQITAEILRRPPIPDPDDVTNTLRAVCMLPGAGEFVLGTQVYQSSDGFGSWFPENVHTPSGIPDVYSALDQLDATLPGRQAVSLVVSWFGTDLRAGNCRIVPKVETSTKTVRPVDWAVAGLTRASAQVVSQIAASALDPTGLSELSPATGTVPAFGGTPSDDTVVQAIQAMNGRGLRVQFYPFVMMDIAPGNGLPDPHGGAEQAAYPWRGRVTCYPGPAQAGSADRTAAAADQAAAFFAAYAPMVLHYAGLCASAGGVDTFIIGSELVGLTQLRAGSGDAPYPAVAALKSLAAQVKSILPGSKVGYAADWTEYHSHRPSDGTNDVIFNMDPLWSDPNIDFVGIDNYLPLSDWRDGAPNVDEDPVNGPSTIYDKTYLQANIEGGEDYAWYYASDADRVAQTRTPIIDTAHGQHWVFRQKDFRSWWTNPHISRPGGVQEGSPTAWVPQSKPLRFTEFGCPAVDKGPNQPNVFYDPKSSESSLPYFSTGSKDDPVQRAYLEATLSYWRDHAPMSSVYGGPMLSTADMYAWAWDARPFPDFPARTAVWHDTANYELGHWLTGRLGEVPLKWIIAELCSAAGVATVDTSALMSPSTLVLGYATDALMSPRDILAGLMDAHQFDARESGGVLQFFARGNVRVTALDVAHLAVEDAQDPGYSVTRAGDTDLPGALRLTFADPFRDYASASVEARRATGNSQNVSQLATAAVLDPAYASDTATSLLQQVWAGRETGTVKLPPSLLALDVGDAITLGFDGVTLPFRIASTDSGTDRTAELVGFDPSLLRVTSPPQPRSGRPKVGSYGPPVIAFVPLPPVTGAEPDLWAPRIAASASPWCGIDVYRANGGGGWDYAVTVETPAAIGALTAPLFPGPVNRWDMGNTVSLRLFGGGQLLSLAEAQALAGAGALAVENAALGAWEVLQYQDAQLVGAGSYNLTTLLRGQIGTEGAMGDPVPAGARVVVLDTNSLAVLPMSLDQVGLVQRLRYGPSVYAVSDPTYTEVDLAFPATGLRPLSVSQIAGTRALPARDVLFTWVRRTRFAGDGWDVDTVPLNEEAELYDLEITDGHGTVLRTVPGLTAPSWLYPTALQAADFGAPQPAYTVNVYQLSAVVGRGQGDHSEGLSVSTSPNLRLPYLDANQNQKSVTHNAALRMLDALVNLHVASAALSAPPATPNDGQCWIVASGGTGAWLGKDFNVAAWQDGAWSFYAPNPGTVAYVDALGGALVWNGTAWVSLLGAITALALNTLGLGTATDPTNPLSARLNAALFSALPTNASPAGTGDVRVKLSKQGAGNTASLLFQDNYAGRAEIGLLGDDNFHVKVSSDGSTFVDAIVVAAAGGAVSFLLSPTAPTPAAGDSTTKLATTGFVAAAVASGGIVASVAGRTGAVTLAVADVAGAAPLASPALTGTPTAPNAAAGTNSAQLATTSFVAASFVTYPYASATYATAANATLTGTPTAPTASQNDNSTKLATTAYADRAANAGNLTRRQVADVAATVLASDRVVAVTALTAARILTLPAASAYPGGATLTVVDESGACSATATLTVAAAGSDTINGAASAVIASAYGYLALESNTFNKWTVVDSPASPGITAPIGDNSAKLATTAFARSNARRPGLFHVYRGAAAQTGISGFTKFQLDTKEYDLDGWYDNTTNYRYAPQEAGYYLLYCGCQLTMGAATTDGAVAAIYKNGAMSRQSGPMFSLSSALCVSGAAEVMTMIYLNGTSDYVEFYVYTTPGGSSTSGSGSISQYRNYAGGCKVSA